MSTLFHHLILAAPLFVLVFAGYALMRFTGWPHSFAEALNRFVFVVALPALLFRLMSDLSKLPPVDARLLIAFFGSCLLVFVFGRLVAWKVFRLDGTAQSIFALGGIFSNNALLGLPLAKLTLGEAALPSVALVLVFNSLFLWTLVTISVQWAQHGHFSVAGIARTVKSVLTNPIIVAILGGTAVGLTGIALPHVIDRPLELIGSAGAPLALIALGMGLSEYGLRHEWRISASISAIKLVVQPLVVWLLARLLGLPKMETQAVVLLASIAVGANVYLMSRHFRTLEGAVGNSLLLSTALASLTTPVMLTLTG